MYCYGYINISIFGQKAAIPRRVEYTTSDYTASDYTASDYLGGFKKARKGEQLSFLCFRVSNGNTVFAFVGFLSGGRQFTTIQFTPIQLTPIQYSWPQYSWPQYSLPQYSWPQYSLPQYLKKNLKKSWPTLILISKISISYNVGRPQENYWNTVNQQN